MRDRVKCMCESWVVCEGLGVQETKCVAEIEGEQDKNDSLGQD